ncbi:hypothetical protein ACF06W_20060 [Streptomyces albus]|uniref:hypothetical protein n=1 Tax=Streptomyces albus TaxID=1888 RepID=UPI0036FF9B6E
MNHQNARPARAREASAMFLQLLEALGTFFGGLAALIAAITQLLTFLKKKENNEDVGCGDRPDSWMSPPQALILLTAWA